MGFDLVDLTLKTVYSAPVDLNLVGLNIINVKLKRYRWLGSGLGSLQALGNAGEQCGAGLVN